MGRDSIGGLTREGLSEEELELYSRQIVLQEIDYDGQVRLLNGKACIVGMGGLGSAAATQLAAMGVGYLRIVDHDVVELSNLPRQHLYDRSSLGYPKVEAAAKSLRRLNPQVEMETLTTSIAPSSAMDVVRGMDVVVDGLDQMMPRYALNRACLKLGVPYIFGAALGSRGNISTIIPGKTACLECFYGDLNDARLPRCGTIGVHPSVVGILASIQVAEATRLISGRPPRLAGTLLYCDLEDMTFDHISVPPSARCPICGPRPVAGPKPLRRQPVRELCGRKGRKTFVLTPKNDLDLDIDGLASGVRRMGHSIAVRGELGLTFNTERGERASVLKSGVMILEGPCSKQDALDFYSNLLRQT